MKKREVARARGCFCVLVPGLQMSGGLGEGPGSESDGRGKDSVCLSPALSQPGYTYLLSGWMGG
jgi:hypothetical protein